MIGSFQEILKEQREYEAEISSSPESLGSNNSDSEPKSSDAKRFKANGSQEGGFESPNPFSVLETEDMEANSDNGHAHRPNSGRTIGQ